MPNLNAFKERLENSISIDLTAKELAEKVVMAALECEYGHNFTLTPGFARMVNTLADSIVAHPELRRQALAITSFLVKESSGQKDLT